MFTLFNPSRFFNGCASHLAESEIPRAYRTLEDCEWLGTAAGPPLLSWRLCALQPQSAGPPSLTSWPPRPLFLLVPAASVRVTCWLVVTVLSEMKEAFELF